MNSDKKRLTRSTSDKMIAGVLGGIAKNQGIDASWLRIGTVLVSLFTFGGVILAYLAAALIIPKDKSN